MLIYVKYQMNKLFDWSKKNKLLFFNKNDNLLIKQIVWSKKKISHSGSVINFREKSYICMV